MKDQAKKQGKFVKVMLAPVKFIGKILGKATDFYKNCINECAGKTGYGTAILCPVSTPWSFGSSSSKTSEDEELRLLLRSVSRRRLVSETMESSMMHMQKHGGSTESINTWSNGLGRSYGVEVGKIGRIDEDVPCSFEEDWFNPRNNSCVSQRKFVYY